MKRGSKHSPVCCQHKQGCLLEQCSHLLFSVPSYTVGYCYAFWHLWYCSEEARALCFQISDAAEGRSKLEVKKILPALKNYF